MDSSNTLSDTLFESSDTSFSSDSEGGLFSKFNTTTWILIIIILAFLGINIFAYLAEGTQTITDFFAPIMKAIFGESANVVGQVVDVSAEGAKKVVDDTADVIDKSLTAVQNATPNNASLKGDKYSQEPSNASQSQSALNNANNEQPNYQAHDAQSSVYTGKSGWCYIGNDRGFRACSEIGTNDTCMSGDIFPTQEICMNPKLRV